MWRIACLLACIGVSVGAGAGTGAHLHGTAARPLASTAAEVIERNVAARGGIEAWRKVDTMAWLGHLDRASKNGQPVPICDAVEATESDVLRIEGTIPPSSRGSSTAPMAMSRASRPATDNLDM
jgi:hypothetical protein